MFRPKTTHSNALQHAHLCETPHLFVRSGNVQYISLVISVRKCCKMIMPIGTHSPQNVLPWYPLCMILLTIPIWYVPYTLQTRAKALPLFVWVCD